MEGETIFCRIARLLTMQRRTPNWRRIASPYTIFDCHEIGANEFGWREELGSVFEPKRTHHQGPKSVSLFLFCAAQYSKAYSHTEPQLIRTAEACKLK